MLQPADLGLEQRDLSVALGEMLLEHRDLGVALGEARRQALVEVLRQPGNFRSEAVLERLYHPFDRTDEGEAELVGR